MNRHDPAIEDAEFWAPLEQVLDKNSKQIEAIVLDWCYEIFYHAVTKTDLEAWRNTDRFIGYIIHPNDPLLVRLKSLPTLFPKEKPKTIPLLYKALQEITGLPRTQTFIQALWMLRTVVSYARAGTFIVYTTRQGVQKRLRDPRIPFPTLSTETMFSS